MASSHVFRTDRPPPTAVRRAVLVTGAAGRIGSYLAEQTASRYELKLMVHSLDERSGALAKHGQVEAGSLDDIEGLKALCKGVDTVVHLAGEPDPSAVWNDLLRANIVGTYNLMVAAKGAGCRRVIYASSIHAVSGYPRDVQVSTEDPVNPGDLYGVSKCFSEALGRYMAVQEGLSVIAVRIGAFQPIEVAQEGNLGFMDAFVSKRDLCDLLVKCIDDEELQFAIFHGVSDNRFKRLDISDARELVRYEPMDDFTEENPQLAPLDLQHTVKASNLKDSGRESGLREEL